MSEPKTELQTALNGGVIALIGCGKMGGAMLEGWLANGAPAERLRVVEPAPSDELRARAAEAGFELLSEPEALAADVVVLAVKPQMLDAVLPKVAAATPNGALILSVAAGATIAALQRPFGPDAAVIRSMPNTPSAVGRGATVMVAAPTVSDDQRRLADALLSAVGTVVWLEDEALMDAVTGVSGSGPAYVFHMIEALAEAGVAQGLPTDLAMTLARATVSGAGELARQSDESAAQLRINVTSPNGTTAAGLAELMDEANGLRPLMRRTVAAATRRSRELGA